jgi:hypothetical protein
MFPLIFQSSMGPKKSRFDILNGLTKKRGHHQVTDALDWFLAITYIKQNSNFQALTLSQKSRCPECKTNIFSAQLASNALHRSLPSTKPQIVHQPFRIQPGSHLQNILIYSQQCTYHVTLPQMFLQPHLLSPSSL